MLQQHLLGIFDQLYTAVTWRKWDAELNQGWHSQARRKSYIMPIRKEEEMMSYTFHFARSLSASWSSTAGLSAQRLPVTRQAGGPKGRKLPGFTVASGAPPQPPLTLSHLSICANTWKKTQHSGSSMFFGLLVVFWGWECYNVSVRVNSAAAGYSYNSWAAVHQPG